tara:strand:- start:4144 stop:4728 length:585 start_codon:yes stop_codon:yes gene_type:complete
MGELILEMILTQVSFILWSRLKSKKDQNLDGALMKTLKYLIAFLIISSTFAQDGIRALKFEKFYELYEDRFTKTEQGIIKDALTGLQWLEGPDKPTSWQMADKWVKSLGDNWRLPTTKELSQIYLKNSKRKGKYGDPLCLDYNFTRDSGYSLWSVLRSDNSAYMYDFSRGYYHWTEIVVKGYFDRAIAVRDMSQ